MEGEPQGQRLTKFRSSNNLASETRSQFQIPINNSKIPNFEDFRSRVNVPQSFYNRKAFKSPEISPSKKRNDNRLNTLGYGSRVMDSPDFGGLGGAGGGHRETDNR